MLAMLRLEGPARDSLDQGRQLVSEAQVPHMDEAAIAARVVRAQPAEPLAVAVALGDFHPEVLERSKSTAVADRVAEPQQPLLPVLAVELMPLESGRPQPLAANRQPLSSWR